MELLRSVGNFSPELWDHFASAGCNNPFLRHDWLRCLEASNSVCPDTGWTPRHIILRRVSSSESESDTGASRNDDDVNAAKPSDDDIIAIAPAYVKHHSLGEFVFDQEWADAAYAAAIPYYPKLLLAVPFTPATGRRILTRPSVTPAQRASILRLMPDVLVNVCNALSVSSVHVNFCTPDEADALCTNGRFLRRKGVQYHFTNYRKGAQTHARFESQLAQKTAPTPTPSAADDVVERPVARVDPDVAIAAFQQLLGENGNMEAAREPYRDFEDYLGEFKSKRRIQMRRERTVVREESGLVIEVVQGENITPQLVDTMFDIYRSTIEKMMFGRQYLSRAFFRLIAASPDFRHRLCLIIARKRADGAVIAGTFNVLGDDAFYGRYWGCLEEFRYLHFETCYYAAIEFCIRNGLARMEPGAGGGDFKYMRGFEPALTSSVHFIRDERLSDAVARYLQLETMHVDGVVVQMKRQSAIRSKSEQTQQQQQQQPLPPQ